MKTKAQKEVEVSEAKELLKKSDALVFVDFNKVSAEDLRNLRREVRAAGNSMLVLKKRLLGVALKEKGIEFDSKQFAGSLGTVFSGQGLETASSAVYKFFSSLGEDKEAKVGRIGSCEERNGYARDDSFLRPIAAERSRAFYGPWNVHRPYQILYVSDGREIPFDKLRVN
ncbi:MAG: hypothetical protein UX23_C0015G0011 [Parcubacteria group bacterium GW2011_GWB1_45_9]|nr:MAG: hypothetical protein UX23_C0015G0011 [Parcubacteria group bacterium GW2011_GWB1_45_9]